MNENFSYTVQKGDTMSSILKKQNIKPINYNKLPHTIHIGDTVKIGKDGNLYLNEEKLYQITNGTTKDIEEIKKEITNTSPKVLEQIDNYNKKHIKSIIDDLRNYKIPKRLKNNPEIFEKVKNEYNKLLEIIQNPNNPDYNNILYGEIPEKYAKNKSGTFIAEGLLDREDGRKDLEVNKKGKENSILLKQRDGTYILAYYGPNGDLEVATYASPGKNDGEHETKIKTNYLIPRYGGLKDKYHLSNSPGKDFDNAIMLYAISQEGAQSIHFGMTNGKPRSHGCIRIPMFYAKALFEKIGNNDNISIKAENLYEEKQTSSEQIDKYQVKNNIQVIESFPA